MNLPSAEQLVEILDSSKDLQHVRLGTIIAVFSKGASATVQFDGETVTSPNRRICIRYTARVGDRVVLLRVGHSWVVLGSVFPNINTAVPLDHIALTGTVGTGSNLIVPEEMRGKFRSYMLQIDAGVAAFTPAVVRVNGDAGSVYRAQAIAWSSAGAVLASSDLNDTNLPRVGFLGSFSSSILNIIYRPRTVGDTGLITWSSEGWANNGVSGSGMVKAGGRWNGSVQSITHFTVRTSVLAHVWADSSSATLWGYLAAP